MWQRSLPLMARALVKSSERLYVAGPPDLLAYVEEPDKHPWYIASSSALKAQEASLAGEKGGVLEVVSASSGEPLASYALDAPPAWDGMAAAYNQLYVSLTNGQLVCLTAK
jgi:hypothetical protein